MTAPKTDRDIFSKYRMYSSANRCTKPETDTFRSAADITLSDAQQANWFSISALAIKIVNGITEAPLTSFRG